MATFTGSGTAESPYLVETKEQFKEAFEDESYPGKYYEVVKNIDLLNMAVGGYKDVYIQFDGKGHVISNAVFSSPYLWQRMRGTFQNIHMELYPNTASRKLSYLCSSTVSNNHIKNVRLDIHGETTTWPTFNTNIDNAVTCIITENTQANGRRTYVFNGGRNVKADITGNDTAASSYPSIDDTIWDITGGGVPVLIPQQGDYSQYTHVAGKTLVDGVGKPRVVRAVTADRHNLIAEVVSGADGSYDLGTTPYTHGILVYTFDDYGTTLQPGKVYAVDDVVHPKQGNGHRYVCVQAGTSSDPLPDMPWPTDQLTTGTAIFNAEKILQPFMHGPVTPVPIFSS